MKKLKAKEMKLVKAGENAAAIYSSNTIGNISSLFSNVLYTPRSVQLNS